MDRSARQQPHDALPSPPSPRSAAEALGRRLNHLLLAASRRRADACDEADSAGSSRAGTGAPQAAGGKTRPGHGVHTAQFCPPQRMHFSVPPGARLIPGPDGYWYYFVFHQPCEMCDSSFLDPLDRVYRHKDVLSEYIGQLIPMQVPPMGLPPTANSASQVTRIRIGALVHAQMSVPTEQQIQQLVPQTAATPCGCLPDKSVSMQRPELHRAPHYVSVPFGTALNLPPYRPMLEPEVMQPLHQIQIVPSLSRQQQQHVTAPILNQHQRGTVIPQNHYDHNELQQRQQRNVIHPMVGTMMRQPHQQQQISAMMCQPQPQHQQMAAMLCQPQPQRQQMAAMLYQPQQQQQQQQMAAMLCQQQQQQMGALLSQPRPQPLQQQHTADILSQPRPQEQQQRPQQQQMPGTLRNNDHSNSTTLPQQVNNDLNNRS